ncbi:MAG TPA: hypothetical protein VKZ60_19870 [Chloroflexota bacterium]|jgi:protein-S-isoprenylcysteine O-methyltransferase Ste14|nr:hypothetical protein [Chloroflexota bacterium]
MAEKRYEREIDELLRRLEVEYRDPIPFRPRRRPRPWTVARQRLGAALARASLVEQLLLAAIALLGAGLLVRLAGGAQAWVLGLLAVVCFFGGLALAVWQGAQRPYSLRGGYPAPPRLDLDRLLYRLRRWLRGRGW